MRYLATITMLVLALAMAQPVAAQSFKPDPGAGIAAWKQKDYPGSATRSQQAVPSTATSASAALAPPLLISPGFWVRFFCAAGK